MAEQTLTMPGGGASVDVNVVQWNSASNRPQVTDSDLLEGITGSRYVALVSLRATGEVFISFDSSSSGIDDSNVDLSAAFESDGYVVCTTTHATVTVELAGADTAEPYFWTPANSAEVIAFHAAHVGQIPGPLTLTLGIETIPEMAFNTFTAAEWSYSHPTLGSLDIVEAAFNDTVLL